MATWYISPTGNDTTGNGSSGNPWQTISKAHTSASSGDTVICKSGTYTWVSQTFTKSLTIQGESIPVYDPITKSWTGAVFNGAGATLIWDGGANTGTIEKLIFTNATPVTTGNGARWGLFYYTTFTMRYCVIYNVVWTGSGGNQSGMLTTPYNGLTITIQGNIFYAPTSGATALLANQFTTGLSTIVITVTGNVIYAANALADFYVFAAGTFSFVTKNNIFVNTGASKALINMPPTGNVYSNNCAYGNWSSTPSGSNNITSDPLFVDAANGDFRLRPASPCINTGVAL